RAAELAGLSAARRRLAGVAGRPGDAAGTRALPAKLRNGAHLWRYCTQCRAVRPLTGDHGCARLPAARGLGAGARCRAHRGPAVPIALRAVGARRRSALPARDELRHAPGRSDARRRRLAGPSERAIRPAGYRKWMTNRKAKGMIAFAFS